MLPWRRTAWISIDNLPMWLVMAPAVWLGIELGHWIVYASSGPRRVIAILAIMAAVTLVGLSVPRPTRPTRDRNATPGDAPHDTSLL